jgi:hypothetical protein
MISNKDTSLDTAFQWIVVCKKIELANDEIQSIKNTLRSIPSYASLKDHLAIVHSENLSISRPLFEQHWIQKLAEATTDDKQRIAAYFSA